MTIITGRLLTAGQITTCDNYPQDFADDLNFDRTSGVLLSMTDGNVRAAAASLLNKEVEIQLAGEIDATIANLRELLEFKRKEIAGLSLALQRYKDRDLDIARDL